MGNHSQKKPAESNHKISLIRLTAVPLRQKITPAKAPERNSIMKLQKVYHMGIPVDNLDRAKDFYTQVLGM
jgi:catechol-2,3-dioxygenase